MNVAGAPVGSVKQISLSDDGQALVKMEISNSDVNATPLPPGGPSGYAGRNVAPNFPSEFGGGSIPEILPDQ